MKAHNEANPEHVIAFSFSDFSYWCYSCDSYVISDDLLDHDKPGCKNSFYDQKFGSE
jgi:hypothetical protein